MFCGVELNTPANVCVKTKDVANENSLKHYKAVYYGAFLSSSGNKRGTYTKNHISIASIKMNGDPETATLFASQNSPNKNGLDRFGNFNSTSSDLIRSRLKVLSA